MGITYVEGSVSGPTGETMKVNFLVDSGAKYSLLPHVVWTRLEIVPKRRERFQLADGTIVGRPVSECRVEFSWGDGHTPVILGDPGDEIALLGAVTLEEFGLVLDPLRRSLQKARLLLMRIA
ncbi:MAG: aspartyl protease family protein [Chloroflexi bacterium]|nr:aspartyl protease family protein [Chloroflexota bacterium]